MRLKLLRFPPIIGVIYIHAYSTTIQYAGRTIGTDDLNTLTEFIRNLISQGLARLAVPLFFLISGYLFFANFKWSQQTYGKKVRSRIRTLLIPFLFWNLLGLTVAALFQAFPSVNIVPYFTVENTPIAQFTALDYFNAILGLQWYPVAYHFWFIRDLMLLVLMAPVLAVILRFAALPFFIVMYICWVCSIWPLYEPKVLGWVFGVVPVLLPATMGLFFFSAGAFCSLKGRSLVDLDKYGPVALIAYVPIVLADAIWYTAWFNVYLHRTGLIVGIVAALYTTRLMLRHERLRDWIITLGEASFFVYAAHEPLLKIIRTLAFKSIPLDGPYTMLLLYLAIPVVVVAILVFCHQMLTVLCPRGLSLVTGGR
jgi:surface polysaccharide O-acyltransferase-like enzyme